MLIDSHCHLDFPELHAQLPQCLQAMKDNGVGRALCIGVNLEDFPRVLALAENHEALFASVGVHPEYTDCQEPTVEDLVQRATHPKVLAIGETGLDYHWHPDHPVWQQDRFRVHIEAARRVQKPLIVHTRQSAVDTLAILAEQGAQAIGGIMHCFTESWEIAEQALALGFHLSFSGIVSFKNAAVVKEVAQRVPLDRLLVETDAPYLAPVPHRGKLNQPAYVVHVAQAIADLRGVPMEAIVQASTENFFRLFPAAR